MVYVVMGINADAERVVLALWVGPICVQSARFWLGVMTELPKRWTSDVLMLCCDEPKGLPDTEKASLPLVNIQLWCGHLVHNSLRYAGKKHRGQITVYLSES